MGIRQRTLAACVRILNGFNIAKLLCFYESLSSAFLIMLARQRFSIVYYRCSPSFSASSRCHNFPSACSAMDFIYCHPIPVAPMSRITLSPSLPWAFSSSSPPRWYHLQAFFSSQVVPSSGLLLLPGGTIFRSSSPPRWYHRQVFFSSQVVPSSGLFLLQGDTIFRYSSPPMW